MLAQPSVSGQAWASKRARPCPTKKGWPRNSRAGRRSRGLPALPRNGLNRIIIAIFLSQMKLGEFRLREQTLGIGGVATSQLLREVLAPPTSVDVRHYQNQAEHPDYHGEVRNIGSYWPNPDKVRYHPLNCSLANVGERAPHYQAQGHHQ